MGIAIGTTIANASDQGLGNIFLHKQYISNGGIFDADTITALETFESTLREKALVSKLSKLFLFTGKAQSDAIDFLNPSNTDLVFANDEATDHTKALGYTASGDNGKYISESNSRVVQPVSTMHFHAYNTTPDNSNDPDVLLRVALGDNFLAELRRNQAGRTRGSLGLISPETEGQVLAVNGYDTTKTGLLTISRQIDTVKLYDKGVEIGSKAVTPFTGTSENAKIMLLQSFGNNTPELSVRSFSWGSSEWTAQNEQDLSDALDALNVALSS